MKSRLVTVVAGIPPEIEDQFGTITRNISTEKKNIVWVWGKLPQTSPYTSEYADALYEKLYSRLEQDPFSENRRRFLESTNLLVTYIEKGDGTETRIQKRFEIEGILKPIQIQGFKQALTERKGQKNRLKKLIEQRIRKAIRHSEKLLEAIKEETQKRTNSTCLLLPPKNFGRTFDRITSLIQETSSEFVNPSTFGERLRKTRDRHIDIQKNHYVGHRGQKFKAAKIPNRHGTAPLPKKKEEQQHKTSCILRGRLRFGTPYDPTFHYDCPIEGRKEFTSCHGQRVRIPTNKSYTNIAPNDNVRK